MNPFKSMNYCLLDCGGGERLEQLGSCIIRRPAPQADFKKALPGLWKKAELCFSRAGGWDSSSSGSIPDFKYGKMTMALECFAGGQIGLYPEQRVNWDWLGRGLSAWGRGSGAGEPLGIFNGFAYTGASSLACALADADVEVCHLDAARGAVSRARINRERSGLPFGTIRFITEDIMTFLRREQRRGRRYGGMILDPPAFGRSKKGKTWVLKRDLPELLALCRQVLAKQPLFFLLSCHDPSLTKTDLGKALAGFSGIGEKDIETLDLILESEKGNSLSNGMAARWFDPAFMSRPSGTGKGGGL